ncbi:Rne/Rng family ribonuclease [Shimia sediminis]|uniref:Rne/Rng family ribonuclease n=1 Tax=Shimia sediminis TaxID=2497945 RepID=UPI000F8EA6AD|nr:ribonuclease E/G [Shimia sediminis]
MPKKMLIDATHAEETRVVVVDGNKVEEFDFESENKRQLAGNIYLAKVTRVEPSLQAAFVDYGGNRHGFLAFSEIHPDYYQIPVADREALMEEERAYAESMKARDDDEDDKKKKPSRTRSRSRSRTKTKKDVTATEAVEAMETTDDAVQIDGMETIDLGEDTTEGLSPMELVQETPVEEPAEESDVAEAAVDTAEEPVAEVTEEAPAEEAVAEAEAEAEAAPEEVAEAAETAEDAPKDDKGGKTMAAKTEGDDPVATKDPETGEETQSDGSETGAEAPVEAATDEAPAEEAAEEAAEEVAEAAPVVKKTRRTRTKAKAAVKADSAEEVSSEADEDDGTEAPDEEDDEPAAKGSRASAKDESIESVADEDDSEDIRPPRKPRPRRYKIQEVIKVRQIMLVQVVKEERGNKGAALTTYLSLAGRYCVLMPNTARGGGISRKITNAVDRKKLKEIANEIDVPQGAGLIVRTAGAKRTKAEIKRDYEYLQRMWEQIRELTLKSIAPAKIYEEGDLIKRSIRDLYNREIDEVFVEGERGYRIAKDFMKMIMPSHAKNVKKYEEGLPLFARYQVESYLSSMFNPTVQLKSGGYIVIGVTEALVAIDVNSGRATKEGSIEETALKTNLEAAEEVARQLRLRDLAGLIVIDFIDMDERKNNAAVEKRMKDRLKTDRARIQVGRISGFGLMEMSRQRLRPGMIEATTQPCPACHGTGLIRSDDNLALSILRQIEEEGTRRRSREVLVKCPVAIANYIMNQKREHVAQIEARYGLSVRIEGDVHLISPDFSIEKFKTATRVVAEVSAPVVSVDTSIMDAVDEEDAAPEEAVTSAPVSDTVEEDGEGKPKRRRRRRRRRKSGNGPEGQAADGQENAEAATEEASDAEGEAEAAAEATDDGEEKPKKTRARRSRSRGRKAKVEDAEVVEETAAGETPAEAAEDAAPEVADAEVNGTVAEAAAPEVAETIVTEPAEAAVEEAAPEVTEDAAQAAEEVAPEPEPDPAPEPEPVSEPVPASPPKPKRKGWWSMGS